MREFDTGEFARIAHELGVTPDDLDTLVRRGPHVIEELPKLLTAQRQHLEKEERLLFPAAVKALRSKDWTEMDARLDDRKDPLFNSVVEEKFYLQKTILR